MTTTHETVLDHRLSREFLLRQRVCPLRIDDDGRLVLAVGHEHSPQAITDIAHLARRTTRTEPVADSDLEQHIERLCTHRDRGDGGVETIEDDLSLEDVRELANQPPVARYVNLLLRDAYDAQASDVHLEASRSGLTARFRLDGVLQTAPEPPRALQLAVVSRLKAMAALDVTERRRPQDGRIRIRLEERELDLRIATVPTVHGESVALRLLDAGGRPADLNALGMPDAILATTALAAGRPHGLVLVTGPTGSGKTTTLYAALQLRSANTEKIITVEDPVEYHLSGITQVPVHRQTGVTFAAVLRAILRQDPDVVMVGEMRDRETAEVAVQAAMTGHLVMSTLHTNDAVSAVARLTDLGVPKFLIAATLELVIAQRLVRQLCPECAVWSEDEPSAGAIVAVTDSAPARSRRAVGCERCRGTGFRGRTGVFEAIPIGDAVRAAIAEGASAEELRRCAEREGFAPMRSHGAALCASGVTTTAEVLRAVTG